MLGYILQRFSGKSNEDHDRDRLGWDKGVSRSPSSKGWVKPALRPKGSSRPGVDTHTPPTFLSIEEAGISSPEWHQPGASPTRSLPPNVSWLRNDSQPTANTGAEESSFSIGYPSRLLAPNNPLRPIYGLNRSNSLPLPHAASLSPAPSTSTMKSTTPAPSTPRWGLRLQTDPAFVGSTQSLHLDSQQPSLSEELHGAYAYPMVKQLSPIAEQDYFSPTSLKTNPLPASPDHDASASISYSHTNRSPNGSQHSDITRPSPIYAPFISRPLNRTLSQTSSRTHISTTSTLPKSTTTPVSAPTIPPLDLRPPFPGPHPSNTYNASGPSLRPPKSATTPTMPTIAGSAEDYAGGSTSGDGSRYSLHADSFVTATDSMNGDSPGGHTTKSEDNKPGNGAHTMDMDITEMPTEENAGDPSPDVYENPFDTESQRGRPIRVPSVSGSVPLSATSSGFILARWEHDAALGTGTVTFPRVKKQRFEYTPACWMFWLCFLCPPLWFVGGWYITIFAEAYTFRDPDDDWHWWGIRKRAARKRRRKVQELQLPQWVREKQQISDGASSTRRALRGISYLYPFVARPIDPSPPRGMLMRATSRVLGVLGKMNRVLDKIPYVKLVEVDGERESDRRMFDPWIQRCRYAWCWFFILWCCIGVPGLFLIRQFCTTCLRDDP